MGPSVDAQRFGELACEHLVVAVERGGVGIIEQDAEDRRHVAAPRPHAAFGLHDALQRTLDLDGLHARLKKARGGPLEKPLEEPLDRGKGACHFGRRV